MHMIAVPSVGVSHNLNYDDNNVTSSTTIQNDIGSLPCTSAIADAEEELCGTNNYQDVACGMNSRPATT
ncbi:hypothetical protein KCU77_g7680, partial [Aureobasidium melanogenum]